MKNQGNVLVIGNSGVGKSTLINAVLGEDVAKTGFGTEGTTKRLEIFDNDEVPFRVIDTVGFEPSFVKEFRAINSVRKWSKESTKEKNRKINVIWFCVDGTAGKLFEKAINSLARATSMWKTVPIVVVITKSFSEPDRIQNIEMVNKAFEKQKKQPKAIVPVVASTFTINESAFAPPEGITELIDITNNLMPEGQKAATNDLGRFKLNRKRAHAHTLVGGAVLSSIAIAAGNPLGIADGTILSAIEVGLINGLAKIYEIDKDDVDIFNESVLAMAPISVIARTTVGALKTVPGIRLGAKVIQAIVAGTFVAAIGQGSIYIFEKVYKGEKNLSDIDWISQVMKERFSDEFTKKVTNLTKIINENKDGSNKDLIQEIGKLIIEMFVLNSKSPTNK